MDEQRKALMKPFELLGIAAVCGLVVFGVLVLTTRNVVNGLIAGGSVFIIALVVLAMLVLSYKPNDSVDHYLDRFDVGESKEATTETGNEPAATDGETNLEEAPATTQASEASTEVDDEAQDEELSSRESGV